MARRTDHGTTIQLWPGGQSITYRGEWNSDRGPLQVHAKISNDRRRWRTATAEERRLIRINERARMYQERDVLRCQSGLVDALIKLAGDGRGDLAEAFGYDEIRNLYKDPSDWDAEQCREYAEDQGIDLPEVPTIPKTITRDLDTSERVTCAICGDLTDARWVRGPSHTCIDHADQIPDPGADEDDSPRGWLTEARDACREHAQDHPAEVFEWWLVTDWLCGQLHEIGEVTIDNGYGCWWGRTCTGQQYIMDGVLQRVAESFEREA